jgi:hypothetical protein
MKKIKSLAWATDTHFELASDKQFKKFLESVKDVDALVITGDVAQATSWQHYLYKVAKKLNPIPVYFILGNHDIYHSDIDTETDKLYSISIPNLHPLSICPPIPLNKNTVLIGHQNWWDGGYSMEETNFIDRTFMFQDYLLIKDLTGLENPRNAASSMFSAIISIASIRSGPMFCMTAAVSVIAIAALDISLLGSLNHSNDNSPLTLSPVSGSIKSQSSSGVSSSSQYIL